MRTVSVACKVPNGVNIGSLKLVDGGLVTAENPVVILGPKPLPPPYVPGQRPGGYLINDNVDADIWDYWYKGHRDSELITRHYLFAHEKRQEVVRWARQHGSVKATQAAPQNNM